MEIVIRSDIKKAHPWGGRESIPFPGNRHFYEDDRGCARNREDVSIPFPGNRHFYPTLAGCPARAAFRGRNLLRLYFFVFSLESNRLFCENL